MEVGIRIGRKIVVDCQVDTFDIDTTSKNIRGNANTLLEVLESLVALDSVRA
tara:strand:- start:279 stop:434 length:156 start_codon:yes stop_codon:yes gene_type:complete